MKEEILKLDNISFRYDEQNEIIKNLTVTINKGEKIAVLGNNGAGKSTFFLLCNGVLSPIDGNIYYNKNVIGKSKKDLNFLREKIGVVFQDPDNQIIASTVYEEISFGVLNLNLPKKDVIARVDKAIDIMNLNDMKNRPPHYLSGGEKKRVTIADILAMKSEIMLLDEPTASLDPKNVEILNQILNMLSEKNITLLVSTHDIDFAYEWADRILVMNDGEIICDDIPENIFSKDDILIKASLKKPLIYEFYTILKNSNKIKINAKIPRNLQELNDILN